MFPRLVKTGSSVRALAPGIINIKTRGGVVPTDNADWFVDAATGNDTNSGLDWDNAFATLSKAISVATTGNETIVVATGEYTNNYTHSTNDITIITSVETGRKGAVTLNCRRTLGSTTTGITYRGTIASPFIMHNDAQFEPSVQLNSGTGSTHEYCIFENAISSRASIYGGGGTHTVKWCQFYDNSDRDYGTTGIQRSIQSTSGGTTITLDTCLIGPGGGQILMTQSGDNLIIKNCGFLVPSGQNNKAIQIGNQNLTINNSYYLGNAQWIDSSASATIALTDCAYSNPTPADDMTGVTEVRSQSEFEPHFTTALGANHLGGGIIRVDDWGNLAVSATASTTLAASGQKLVFYADLYGETTLPTSANVADLRTIVNNSSEVGSHGPAHHKIASSSTATDSIPFTVSSTAGTPTVEISAGTRTGDSSTWTGITLDIKEAGVSVGGNFPIDLTSSSYNTIGEVVSEINGTANWTCTLTTNSHSNMLSRCLRSQASLTISGTTDIPFDWDDYLTIYVDEAVADLQAYIRTGSDRNGANDSGAGAATGDAATYTVKTFATPNGQGHPRLQKKCAEHPTIIGGSRLLDSTTYNHWSYGTEYSAPTDINEVIAISATGTTPTLTISGNQSGPTSAWTLSLQVTINSVNSTNYDLTSASYDTLGELVTELNGLAVGDGVVTCNLLDAYQTSDPSIILNQISSQSISTTYKCQHRHGMFSLFNMGYTQTASDSQTYTALVQAIYGFTSNNILWHGTPNYNSSLANLATLLTGLGGATKTQGEMIQAIIDSARTDIVGPLCWFNSDMRTVMGGWNLKPTTGSDLLDAGVASSQSAHDLNGAAWSSSPSIGPYED